ncbi:MAG: hypothetical protein RIS52_1219 [Pseudomonadota bacterium]
MVETIITYQGHLHCEAVHGPSGSHLGTDAPLDNNGKGETFSPTDLVGAALGSCILTVMGLVARDHKFDMEGATARVEKAMASTGVRRIARLAVSIKIPVDPGDALRKRLENAAHSCPVHKSLHPDIEAPLSFEWGVAPQS